ncbi:hypothetical protein MMC21_002410 [Puttea exsequens]|nr:hypothetical protein [Puttea exsequens]
MLVQHTSWISWTTCLAFFTFAFLYSLSPFQTAGNHPVFKSSSKYSSYVPPYPEPSKATVPSPAVDAQRSIQASAKASVQASIQYITVTTTLSIEAPTCAPSHPEEQGQGSMKETTQRPVKENGQSPSRGKDHSSAIAKRPTKVAIVNTMPDHSEIWAALVHAWGSQPDVELTLFFQPQPFNMQELVNHFKLKISLPDFLYYDMRALEIYEPDIIIITSCEWDLPNVYNKMEKLREGGQTYFFCVPHITWLWHDDHWLIDTLTPWVDNEMVTFLPLAPHMPRGFNTPHKGFLEWDIFQKPKGSSGTQKREFNQEEIEEDQEDQDNQDNEDDPGDHNKHGSEGDRGDKGAEGHKGDKPSQLDWEYKQRNENAWGNPNEDAPVDWAKNAEGLARPLPPIEVFIPVFPTIHHSKEKSQDDTDMGIGLQGHADRGGREYDKYMNYVDKLLHEKDNNTNSRITLHILGTDSGNLQIPESCKYHIFVHSDSDYNDYYTTLGSMTAVSTGWPDHERMIYHDFKVSSSIAASVIAETPLIATKRTLQSYTYLNKEAVWFQEPEDTTLDTIHKLLQSSPEEVKRKKDAVRAIKERLIAENIQQAAKLLQSAKKRLGLV